MGKRIFLGRLPLVIDASTIRKALGDGVEFIHWIPDKTTGLWYGSTFLQMATMYDAKRIVDMANSEGGIRMGKRRLRASFAPLIESDVWPPANFTQLERPPVPVNPGKAK